MDTKRHKQCWRGFAIRASRNNSTDHRSALAGVWEDTENHREYAGARTPCNSV